MMKMQKIVIIGLLMIFGACNNSPKGFVIRGSFPGLQDGTVCLLRNFTDEDELLAVDTVKNGSFKLSGNVANPILAEILFTNESLITPEEEPTERFVSFILDNSEMEVEVEHIDSLLCLYPKRNWKPRVVGGHVQAEYNNYLTRAHSLEFLVDSLDGALIWLQMVYRDDYTPEEFDKRYMELQFAYDEAKEQLDSCRMEFFQEYPKSWISLRFIEQMLYYSFDYTQDEVEKLIRIGEGIPGSLEQCRFKELAEKAKKAYKGIKYTDLDLELPSGKIVKMSDLLPQAGYVLIDFWASWCGPCRAAIPNVKALFEKYNRTQLNMLSVSLDKKRTDWEQAMEEENMPWTQVWAGNGERREKVCLNYNISSIPCLLLLDPEGRVLLSTYNMDLVRLTLKQLLGNK